MSKLKNWTYTKIVGRRGWNENLNAQSLLNSKTGLVPKLAKTKKISFP